MNGPQVFRLAPAGPAAAYRTYGFRRPPATHSRPATCEEVGCEAYLHGWVTRVPAGGLLEVTLQAAGRRHMAREVQPDGVVAYTYPPGTECFASARHRVPVDRPSLYFVRDGDWRGNPTGYLRRHARVQDWVDDFATHTDQIADTIRKG